MELSGGCGGGSSSVDRNRWGPEQRGFQRERGRDESDATRGVLRLRREKMFEGGGHQIVAGGWCIRALARLDVKLAWPGEEITERAITQR